MNQIKVSKRAGWYYVFVDQHPTFSAVALQAVIDWLDENFAPPISVRWSVDARSEQEIKEKYSY